MKSGEGKLDRLERIIATQSLIVQADLDLNAFMQMVVDTLQELTAAKGVVVELAEGDYMVYRCASSSIAHHVGIRLLRETSLSGLCVRLAQVLRCDDAETDPRVDAAACRKVGVRSMVCTPLFEAGVPVGVLKVMSEQAFGFDDEDVQSLGLMAGALGAALGKQVAFEAMTHMAAQVRESEERMRTILEHANDAVISTDNSGHVTQWNRAAERLFGWNAQEVMGRNVADLIVPAARRNAFKEGLPRFIQSGAWAAMNLRKETRAADRQGNELHVEVSLNANNIAGKLEFTAFVHDISERKALEAALRDMALSDGLTGLANRRLFMETLTQAIARQRRSHLGLVLLFMDLNGFKGINDTHGHDVGDQVLKEFARRLTGCVRQSDLVARLGGDEFVVLAEGIHSVSHAQTLAQKIVDSLALPVPGTAIHLATSIGISLYQADADAAQLLRQADSAMYEAKQQRTTPNNIAVFASYGGDYTMPLE